jgi:formylglycine-generating enzyme required for sulfatase activity
MKSVFRDLMFAAVSALGALALTTASASAQSAAVSKAPTNPVAVVLPEMTIIPNQSLEVGKYEVTFAEWDACVAGGGCNGYRPDDKGWGRDRRPVINVSVHDAKAYVLWLNQRTGKSYRLLTAAEWEIAARAGGNAKWYSWGDEDPVCNQNERNGANFIDCTDDRTRPVGSFQANKYGLYDMHGNVWEWVEDTEGRYRESRVYRGGSWASDRMYLRSETRLSDGHSTRSSTGGFRLARTLLPGQ